MNKRNFPIKTSCLLVFIVVCYLVVGALEHNDDYDSLDNVPAVEFELPNDNDYNGPEADQLANPLIRS